MEAKSFGLAATGISILALVVGACAAPALNDDLSHPDRGDGGTKGTDSNSSGGTGTGTGSGRGTTNLPCDVSKVLASKCQTCHASTPKSGAGTSLVTWDDLHKVGPANHGGKKVIDLVKERIHDAKEPMPPGGTMVGHDLDALDKWIAAGAPKGESCDVAAPPASEPLPCTPDVTLKASKPYAMPAGKADQYVCVGVDVNVSKKRHVIALGPHIDNTNILHHILLFQTSSAFSSEPVECAAFGTAGNAKLISGWAPGGKNIILPPEAAFPENVGTTHWMVQLHYNNAQNRPAQSDNSGFSLCTTEDLRPNDAGIVAFGSMHFNIPPRANHKISCDVSTDLLGLTGVKFFAASPHMHRNGVSMMTERVSKLGFGTPEVVHQENNFNFENQDKVPISVTPSAGDVFRTHCAWKNTTDSPIGFGENTGDEMCYHFMTYYPDKGTLWHMPSLLASATCKVEP